MKKQTKKNEDKIKKNNLKTKVVRVQYLGVKRNWIQHRGNYILKNRTTSL